jgi:hypothetical protein
VRRTWSAQAATAGISWPAIDKAKAKSDFFSYLAFILQFCPPIGPAEVEVPLRARFARIGVEAGKAFNLEAMGVEAKLGLLEGAKAGAAQIEARKPLLGTNMNGWTAALDAFGNRARINGDWTRRAAAAELGIYGVRELQVLEKLLRDGQEQALVKVHQTICAKIGWEPGEGDERAFLEAFYAALRAKLETDMRFGKRKADKFS